MRKAISTLFILTCSIAFLSCEKDYTCSCTQTNTSTGKVTRSWSKNGTFSRADADIWCGGDEASGFGTKIECNLK